MGVGRLNAARRDLVESIDPTRIPDDDAGKLFDLFGELANRIAQMKGPIGANDPDWKPNAPATAADLRAHLDRIAHNPHGTNAAQVGAVTKAGDTGVGPLSLAADGADPFSVVTRRQTVQKAGDSGLGPMRSASTVPQFDDQLITKAYADALRAGLSLKPAARVSSTSNHALTAGLPVMDGLQTQEGWRVLLLGQTDRTQNGLWVVSGTGPWTRAADADGSEELPPNTFVFVQGGTARADSGWVLATDGPITLGTTPLDFVQFSQAGVILPGAGLTKSGNTISVATAGIVAAMLANNVLDTSKFVLYRASPLRAGEAPNLSVQTLAERDALTGLRNGQLVYVNEDTQVYKVTSPDGSGPSTNPPAGTPASAFQNIGSSSSLAATGTSGTVKIDTASGDPVAVVVNSPILVGFRQGLTPRWDGPNALTIPAGAAHIPAAGRVVIVPSAISLTGMVLSPNLLYFIYLYLDANGAPAVEYVDGSVAGNAPVAYRGTAFQKGTDNTRRYLGAFRTTSAASPSAMFRWRKVGNYYRYHTMINVPPFRFVNNFGQGAGNNAESPFSMAAIMPPTSNIARLALISSPVHAFYVGDPDDTDALTSGNFLLYSAAGIYVYGDLPTTSLRASVLCGTKDIAYAYIDFMGYYEEV